MANLVESKITSLLPVSSHGLDPLTLGEEDIVPLRHFLDLDAVDGLRPVLLPEMKRDLFDEVYLV